MAGRKTVRTFLIAETLAFIAFFLLANADERG